MQKRKKLKCKSCNNFLPSDFKCSNACKDCDKKCDKEPLVGLCTATRYTEFVLSCYNDCDE